MRKYNYYYSLLVVFIFYLNLKFISSTLDCNLVNDLLDSDLALSQLSSDKQLNPNNISTWSNTSSPHANTPHLSYWEMNPLFSKCGIIPAELVGNKRSHSKFFIHWLFNSHTSFKTSFRLEYVENYTSLNYYYSIRRYTSDETFSRRHRFHETNETESVEEETSIEDALELKDSLKKQFIFKHTRELQNSSSIHESYNHLVVNFDPAPTRYEEKFDMLKNMFIVCVVILNLNSGLTFTLPFMCVDVFTDKSYYKTLKLENDDHTRSLYRKHSLGTMVTLGPLSLIAFAIVAYMYYKRRRDKFVNEKKLIEQSLKQIQNKSVVEEPKETLERIEESDESTFELNSNVILKRKTSEYLNKQRFSRYDLIEDYEQLPTQEEALFNDLKEASLKSNKNSIKSLKSTTPSLKNINNNNKQNQKSNSNFFYLNRYYFDQQDDFLECYV